MIRVWPPVILQCQSTMYVVALFEIRTRLRLGCRRSDSVVVLRGLRRGECGECRIFSLSERNHEYVTSDDIAVIPYYVLSFFPQLILVIQAVRWGTVGGWVKTLDGCLFAAGRRHSESSHLFLVSVVI